MPFSSSSGKAYIDRFMAYLAKIDTAGHRFLDVGPGAGYYSKYRKDFRDSHWTAVEIWQPYLDKYKLCDLYDRVHIADARTFDFGETRYTVSFLGDVLEHMDKESAKQLVAKVARQSWFVVISIPIGHYPQGEYEGNPYEAHVTDNWTVEDVLEAFSGIVWHRIDREIGVFIIGNPNMIENAFHRQIGVYAIAKNEATFAKRFAESCKGADEVVVLDTGSTDDTVSILRDYGVTVQSATIIPWRFDVARNISLSMLSKDIDIAVCLDMDEVMTPGWVDAIRQGWTETTTRLRYEYVWSWKADGQPDLTYYADKIHDRRLYHWFHPVHETMRCISDEVQTFIRHRLIEHYPDTTKSRGQYFPLLELAVREDPHNDRNAHYLGREYMYAGMHDKAIAELTRHLSLPTATWNAERAASMRFIARCHRAKGDLGEARRWFMKAIEEAPDQREPWVDASQLFHDQQDWANCWWAAQNAVKITERPLSYINYGEAWSELPWELLSVSSWHLGMRVAAVAAMKTASEIAPLNQRVLANLVYYDAEMGKVDK